MKCFIVFSLIVSLLCVSARPRRQDDLDKKLLFDLSATDFDLRSPGIGTLSHKGIIVDNQNYKVTGTGYASKDFTNGGAFLKPDAYGAQVDYSHKQSGSVLGVGADHVRGAGTDVRATGTYNFVNTKDAEVGVSGQYEKHFGPGGSRDDYGVFLKGTVSLD